MSLKEKLITFHPESLHPAIREVLDLPYKYTQGPEQVSVVINSREGVNCIWVAHRLTYQLCRVSLPSDLDPVQMILDSPYLKSLSKDEELLLGDMLFVGQAGINEFRVIPSEIRPNNHAVREFIRQFPGPHVAVFTGQTDEQGEALFVHGNYVDKKVSIWPYSRFAHYKRYKEEYARKRPVRER